MNTQVSPQSVYLEKVESGVLCVDEQQLKAIQKLDSLFFQLISHTQPLNWFEKFFNRVKQSPQGIYFWGGVGTGKTVLMDIFYQCLPTHQAQRIHFHRFMQSVHEEKNRIKHEQDPLRSIAKNLYSQYRILCLDEFSVTDITDAMILSGLLRSLFDQGTTLVTTSNTRIDDLYKDGLQRERFIPAIELLKMHTKAVHIDSGIDYRMAYLQEDAIFHTPLGEQANLELTHCFNQLAGAYDKTIQNIPIFGRNVDVVAVDSGSVWFEFKSLCQTNRSKSDYIEIARQFHTILLSNIPQLDSNQDDAARRFIELVDELYDRNVNLIVSSAQAPDKIYIGKRLREHFKRTSSRLIEMSSNDYLARPHLS